MSVKGQLRYKVRYMLNMKQDEINKFCTSVAN